MEIPYFCIQMAYIRSVCVGYVVSLAQAGVTVVDMQIAGRWKSSQMPAHYAKAWSFATEDFDKYSIKTIKLLYFISIFMS